jgi:hypothetical protein
MTPMAEVICLLTLDHFVMVRIHARQVVLRQALTAFTENTLISILATS